MIYTSYFARLKHLPKHIIPISICGKAPSWYNGLQYKKLAPRYEFFIKWKESQDNAYYTDCFKQQVLCRLDWHTVYEELYTLAATVAKDIAHYEICLICYERPTDFCHRHLVADWFNKHNILCEEYSNE